MKQGNNAYRIRENNFLARLAAFKLKSGKVAMVLGNSILLHGVSKDEFLKDKRWVKHELCHLEQFKKYGFIGFIFRYLIETVKHGYQMNKFEVEAREAEDR